MKVSRALNLVVPLYEEESPGLDKDGKPLPPGISAYVHAAPISTEVFDAHWRVLSRTFAALIEQGLLSMGPKIASRMLRTVAQEFGTWDGPAGARLVLIPEIRRLANVLVPGAKGWDLLQFDDAVKTGAISDEDASEVEGALVFFTVSYHNSPHRARKEMMMGSLAPWGARIESSSCTDFLTSLRTSTAGASSGA